MGEKTLKFEQDFANWVGRRFALMVNSGSSANLLAATAFAYQKSSYPSGMERGEVIVPAVSWSTTYFPFHQMGYKLVFVDVDVETFNIDSSKLTEALSPETVGVVGVNLLGEVGPWDKIQSFARDNALWTFEDNCESMGSEKYGKNSGTFGDISSYSFFYSHHICTMEGGMVVCDDEDLYLRMLSLRAHGWGRNIPLDAPFFQEERVNDWQERFRFYLPGYNLRPLEMSAAIGLEQLAKFPILLKTRRANGNLLNKMVSKSNIGWRIQKTTNESSFFTFGFVHPDPIKGNAIRNRVVLDLERHGVQTRPIVAGNFTLNPVMKYLNHRIVGDLENATLIHQNGFMIGNHHFDISDKFEYFLDILSESENI
jgi:CDP-6-deoxy-D-xylo-4-hexulose-3-dehydrase